MAYIGNSLLYYQLFARQKLIDVNNSIISNLKKSKKMKKIIFMAAAVVAFASCSQTELDENFVGQKEIKFSNLNDKVNSRAANDTDADYQVYADWNGSSTEWFINAVVNGTSNVPSGGPYHWPATGTVAFYSWAPSSVTATATYPALSIAYTVPAAADQDFTIAAPKTGMSSGTVDFEFAHMLSKVSVTASLSQELETAGYVLATTGLTAKLDVQSTEGTTDPKVNPAVWTSANTTTASYTGAASYMIMPQSSVGCAIQITGGITITKNGAEIYSGDLNKYTIVAGNVTGDRFDKGKHYMLNLTISDSSTGGGGEDIFNIINFTANVADWDTPAGTDTPLVQP